MKPSTRSCPSQSSIVITITEQDRTIGAFLF